MKHNYKKTHNGTRVSARAERQYKTKLVTVDVEGQKTYPNDPDEWKYQIICQRKDNARVVEHITHEIVTDERLSEYDIIDQIEEYLEKLWTSYQKKFL